MRAGFHNVIGEDESIDDWLREKSQSLVNEGRFPHVCTVREEGGNYIF